MEYKYDPNLKAPKDLKKFVFLVGVIYPLIQLVKLGNAIVEYPNADRHLTSLITLFQIIGVWICLPLIYKMKHYGVIGFAFFYHFPYLMILFFNMNLMLHSNILSLIPTFYAFIRVSKILGKKPNVNKKQLFIYGLFGLVLSIAFINIESKSYQSVKDSFSEQTHSGEYIDMKELELVDSVYFIKSTNNSYTGYVKSFTPYKQDIQSDIVFSEGSMINGKKEGIWKELYPFIMDITYSNGKKNGIYIRWSSDTGRKVEEGFYKNDKKDGTWYSWNINGPMLEEANYQNGLKHGEWKHWYPYGRLYWLQNFEEDILIDERCWDINTGDECVCQKSGRCD